MALRTKKSPYCEEVASVLKLARELRGSETMVPEQAKEMFDREGETKLSDLDDNELLQVLFMEARWFLHQQSEEIKRLSKRNRAQRRH